MIAHGQFPKQIKIGASAKNGAVVWSERDVEVWMEQKRPPRSISRRLRLSRVAYIAKYDSGREPNPDTAGIPNFHDSMSDLNQKWDSVRDHPPY